MYRKGLFLLLHADYKVSVFCKKIVASNYFLYLTVYTNNFPFQITFELIVMSAAVMFIFLGVPLFYCLAAIPLVMLFMYVVVYIGFYAKAMDVIMAKRPLHCWVAEVYHPYFFARNPQVFSYKIIPEHRMQEECLDLSNYQRKVSVR